MHSTMIHNVQNFAGHNPLIPWPPSQLGTVTSLSLSMAPRQEGSGITSVMDTNVATCPPHLTQCFPMATRHQRHCTASITDSSFQLPRQHHRWYAKHHVPPMCTSTPQPAPQPSRSPKLLLFTPWAPNPSLVSSHHVWTMAPRFWEPQSTGCASRTNITE